MSSPEWVAATTGQPPLADQVNQFLVTHPTAYVYTGVEQNHLATAGTGTVTSNGLWVGQKFTASTAFTTGRVVLTLAVTGSPGPLAVSICADNAGVPSSTVLAGPVTLPSQFVPGAAGLVSVPLPGLTVAAGTAYWVVAQPAGDASDFYAWSRANGSSGAATSPDGVTWSAQAYDLLFQVWDDTVVLPLVHTWEDEGARWTGMVANSENQPTLLQEYTVGQSVATPMASAVSLSYSGPSLTSVTATGSTPATPTWSAPHAGLIGDASATAGSSQINQFLGTHAETPVYSGSVISAPSQYTCGQGSPYQVSLLAEDFDQPFTMSGTAVGRVQIPVLPVGNGADLLVSLCADSSGNPGTAITQTRIPASWIYQLAPIAGTATGTPLIPNIALTGNVLATPQSSMLEIADYQFASYPTPATTGISAASSATWYSPYIVQIGGVNGGAALTSVFTVPYGADGTLGASIPQPSFPVTNDGSSASCVAIDAQTGGPVVVNSGGGTSFEGAPVASVYTAALDPATGGLAAWSAQASLPAAVQSHVMCANGSWVYSIGGRNSTSGTLATVYYAQVQNGQISGWSAATPLPVATELAFVGIASGFLYVIGGTNQSLTPLYTNVWYTRVNADGSLGPWLSGPPLPNADNNLNDNAYVNDYGIIAGGRNFISCLPAGPTGPGAQWFQSIGSSGSYPGFYDTGGGLIASGSQYGASQLTYNTYLFPYISVPLPATGLTSSATYHVLLQQQGGTVTDYLLLPIGHDPAIAGRTSSRSAYAWTALPNDGAHVVGSPMSVFDNSAPASGALMPLHLWSDHGARITTIVTTTTPDRRPLGVLESTVQSYALNANQGFETGTDPWFASGGDLEQSHAQAFEGQYSAQVTPSGVDANVYLGSENLPCLPGQAVTVDGRMWFTAAVTGNVSMSINWFTLAGAYITTSSNDVTVPAGTWTQLTNTFTAPAGAYQFAIAATVSGTPAATQVFYVDQVRAYYTYTGPLNATVTGIEYAGTYPWPWPGTGTVQLA